jgi:opacity protein-like surface antigen
VPVSRIQTTWKFLKFPVGASILIALSFFSSFTIAEPRVSVGLFGGYESHDVDYSSAEGDVGLLFDPQDDGNAFGALVGYDLTENWNVSAEYTYSDADDVEIQYLYGTLNYRFQLHDPLVHLNLGAMGGYTELEWQDDPVSTIQSDPESDQWVMGGQAELIYSMNYHVRFTLRYQYWGIEHKSKIRTLTGGAEVRHENQQNILLGLRYHF